MAARDPEATKRRLLSAGLREFAAKGIAGARVDRIAARARTNKRMLYYYFGSKEGLYREILRTRLLEAASALRDDTSRGPDRLVRRFDRAVADPSFIRLLMWEALERGGRSVEGEARGALYRYLVESAAADRDVAESGLDPAQLVLSELALAWFPFAFPQVTAMVTGAGPTDDSFIAARRAFLEALASHIAPEVAPSTR
jgi:AcrR family transcriptional regulator